MALMSGNEESTSRDFGDSSQMTNCILYSGATCHMMPQVSDFVPGTLEDKDKHIEVLDGHHIVAKPKGQVQIKVCDNNVNPFIATLHNIVLAPDLCDTLFLIIALITLGHTCLFHKYFFTVYFGYKEKNAAISPHSAQQKYEFLREINPKSEKIASGKKVGLELLQYRLVHRHNRSFMAGDTEFFWKDIELKKYPYPLCTSCQIYSMNKKARSKDPQNPRAPFK